MQGAAVGEVEGDDGGLRRWGMEVEKRDVCQHRCQIRGGPHPRNLLTVPGLAAGLRGDDMHPCPPRRLSPEW